MRSSSFESISYEEWFKIHEKDLEKQYKNACTARNFLEWARVEYRKQIIADTKKLQAYGENSYVLIHS